MKIKLQKIENKLGEIKFRKKLADQHLGKEFFFKGQPDQKAILKELIKRNQNTSKDIFLLLKKGVAISPFLEIGAEKGQRSMLLVNKYKAQGFAGDLSLESLQTAEALRKPLKLNKLPTLICFDAYNLPFRDNSIPFIFFYETLHHFPDPKPILDEAFRVVRSDGHVFLAEEPVKQLFNLKLWRRDFNLNKFEKILKYTLILPFLSTIGKSEVEHGILEETFWLDVWEKALSTYPYCEAWLKPIFWGSEDYVEKKKGQTNGWLKPGIFTTLLLALQGGGIKCLAKVDKDERKDVYSKNILDLLTCPECKQGKQLTKIKNQFVCSSCKLHFPIISGVIMLLPKVLMNTLYSDLK